MKRILGLLALALLLANCEIKPRGAGAQETPKVIEGKNTRVISATQYLTVKSTTYTKDEVEYIIFWGQPATRQGGSGIHVVNHTKEQLEIRNLRKNMPVI